MPAGGNSRFRGYPARMSERQQLALLLQMTSQEITSGQSSSRSESTLPASNARSSPLHQKSSKSRWSNKNADILDVSNSYNRQDDRLRLNGCDSKERNEFAGSSSPDELQVRTASPVAAESPAECAAEELPSDEMRRTPPQNKADRQGSSSPRVTLRLNQVRAGRDDSKKQQQQQPVNATPRPSSSMMESSSPSGASSTAANEGAESSGDVYEFKSSKEATPVRGASTSPNPDKEGKDKDREARMTNAGAGNAATGSTAGAGTTSSSSSTSTSTITTSSSANNPQNSSGAVSAESLAASVTAAMSDEPMTATSPQSSSSSTTSSTKRAFEGDGGPGDEQDEEGRKRKKKDSTDGNSKEVGSSKGQASNRQTAGRNNSGVAEKSAKSGKQASAVISSKSGQSSSEKSPSALNANSPKPSTASTISSSSTKGATPSAVESDGEDDRSKSSDSGSAPKVPPLKIVIPQSTTSEQEQGNRNGKSTSNRSHQLPYVVASSNNSNDSMDKDQSTTGATSGTTSPLDNSGAASKGDEKKDFSGALDSDSRSTHHQRVLRSSNRSGNGGQSGNGAYSNSSPLPSNAADRSNNSSPQQRHRSPTPESAGASETGKPVSTDSPGQGSTATKPSSSTTEKNEKVEVRKEPVDSSESSTKKDSSSETSNASSQAPVELHPRKRKIKSNKEAQQTTAAEVKSEAQETINTGSEIHPHDQPITNCYQLFLNIRKQIDKRRKNLFPVQPKPPQGFKDYLMNRCTYVLAGNAKNEPNIMVPIELVGAMRELYREQEKERYRLRMQHVVEKEKLVLSVEQEILRVHGRAARALANQSLPFSVCTILKDEEVYNVITPEQEEKDRNARSRYNGRLFLSWLQDVDDKWEKIKEGMLLRHHNEAESLHAVQSMAWEWKMKELDICEKTATPQIDDLHVPMVHVSDDFDLLPA